MTLDMMLEPPVHHWWLQYLYNLEVYGHKQYTRRDKGAIAAAQSAVNSRVNTGELGPLSPLE